MKRAQWKLRLALLLVLIVSIIWFSRPKEPKYQGRYLTAWLDEWGNSYYDQADPAVDAIRAIGTNGVPTLLFLLSKEESPAEHEFWQLAGYVTRSSWGLENRRMNRSLAAAEAINLLGAEAQTAFPILTNLLLSRSNCNLAAIGLAGLGHDGVAVLLQTLTNQDPRLSLPSANALREARSDIVEVVPALFKITKIPGSSATDDLLRGAARTALIHIHKKPELIVPAYEKFLESTNEETHRLVGRLLGEFGFDAKAAIPLLLKLSTYEDPEVRNGAEQILKEINRRRENDARSK